LPIDHLREYCLPHIASQVICAPVSHCVEEREVIVNVSDASQDRIYTVRRPCTVN
jgi:hypothetical protein